MIATIISGPQPRRLHLFFFFPTLSAVETCRLSTPLGPLQLVLMIRNRHDRELFLVGYTILNFIARSVAARPDALKLASLTFRNLWEVELWLVYGTRQTKKTTICHVPVRPLLYRMAVTFSTMRITGRKGPIQVSLDMIKDVDCFLFLLSLFTKRVVL